MNFFEKLKKIVKIVSNFISIQLKYKMLGSGEQPEDDRMSEANSEERKKPVPNYGKEIEDTINNLKEAYKSWNDLNAAMNEKNKSYQKVYKENSIPGGSSKYLFQGEIEKQVENIVAENESLISDLMDKSVAIDDIYSTIKEFLITVSGPTKPMTADQYGELFRKIGTEQYNEMYEKGELDNRRATEKKTEIFEQALFYVMQNRFDGIRENGNENVKPKEYTETEKQAIYDFIVLTAKHKLEVIRYVLEMNIHKGDGYGSHLALIQALSPNLELPETIRKKYGVENVEEYQAETKRIIGKQIAGCIQSVMVGHNENEINGIISFFKSQISEVTGLIAGSKTEEAFIETLSIKLKNPNLTPLRGFLGHLWKSARGISQENSLNTHIVDFEEVGKKPTIIEGELIIDSQGNGANVPKIQDK